MRRLSLFAISLTAVLAMLPSAVLAHGGNPNYRSEFAGVRPAAPGLQVQILNYDDRLLLINRTGKTVVMKGYEGEPYARLLADGTVEVNRHSPSFYLNNERYGGTPVPKSASPKAAPDWSIVDKTGRFETHDHRIHWMSKEAKPPQVKDEGKRTKVFDWRVPVVVGAQQATLTGSLYWVPQSGGGIPTVAIVALVALILLSLGLFVASRRVRARSTHKPAEAWK
jgi:hypothetical protein